ncbi:uncharacterized protein LOC129614046 [Condylostylus longicornis]|uniref:uncharacterized protein LOC129614046 n=1 Tax=Condylostylus longicornis TaxID=2530218 RepID=UPI00244DA615|nr:uncharacterized protein LOC129614046 [Condylostylus longicornis]
MHDSKLLLTVSVCVLAFGLINCADPSAEYLPPAQEVTAVLSDDGYRYKAVKRLKFRHRRDVSELNSEYLPPAQEQEVSVEQDIAQAPVAAPEPAHELASDGYRYKTVKRYRYRIRRDVSELNNEYLPPNQEQVAEVVQEAAPAPEVEPAHELAADGYRYKTVKRYRFRHRRDVSELNNEYLPPNQEVSQEYIPPAQEAAPAPIAAPEPAPAHELAADGYRYKAVKRYRFRHRRDVSELNNEYLPPNQEQVAEVVQEAAPAPEVEPAHELAADGYRYKTVKRYRFRHRRDVSELNNEYLPPNQEVSQEYIPPVQEAAPAPIAAPEPAPAHELASDGYRYKAVKRYRFRHRRDVSELNNEYLPPNQEQVAEVVQEAAPAPEVEPAHELAADGYRYKTVKRYRFRHRRDVSELNNEYLPPNQEVSQEYIPPAQEAAPAPIAAPEPAPAHELASDGYRYKAVKRYRFRHRRDVSELNNEYLPPNQEQVAEVVQEAAPAPEVEPAHELAADGYRYKTVKRYRFRHRRDVSELNNEYLPPNQEVSQEYIPPAQEAAPAPIAAPEPAPAHELAADGYRYKAVKRYRFRHRRDVSELSNEYLPPNQEVSQEYLPPAQEAAPAPVAAPEPAPAHELGSDGYRYKSLRRRLLVALSLCALAFGFISCGEPSGEYLPPNQEVSQEYLPPAQEAGPVPEPAHELANDGYRYKAVKRYRFRHRRDVSELNNEYLPPNQEVSQEYLPPVQGAAPEAAPAHELASDGYRYKAVKRYRFRHRRDVSELNNEYLPPNQEPVAQVVQEAAPAVEVEPAHELAADGYRYKTVKRYRFRHRRDVSELNNEYLPPTQEVSQEYLPPVQGAAPEAAPAHELASDGYRYKAVKRYRFRHRRDVSELNNEYLPPNQEPVAPVVQEAAPEAEPAHELAADGYRYKTVKRYRFRHRRDVSELNNEYLPPTQEVSQEYLPPVQGPAPEAAPAHELASDGYRYKAVKRYRFRHRRDVSELNNEYLPPTQEVSQEYLPPVQGPAPEAAPAHELASDGYRYKAVKRYRFRHRRDVSELNNEYLPPNQEPVAQVVQEAAPAPEVEPAHELAADGYRYKTVKRYRFRHRRDVSELNNEYLPPNQEVSQEYLPPAQEAVSEPEPAHSLGNDGYRYRSIRRKVFRRRY